MKKVKLLILIFLLVIPGVTARAQEYGTEAYDESTSQGVIKADVTLTPGTEVVEMEGLKIIVPKGKKIYSQDGLVIVEESDAYLGRKLDAVEMRLEHLEKEQKELKEEMERLKKDVERKKEDGE